MVTDAQVRRLFRLDREGLSKELAAVKAALDPKTARTYRRLGKLPSEVRRMDRDWRTRPDPFADVWPGLEELLRLHPGLEAKTLFADLQRRLPGRFADGQLRTLQRRLKRWRALHGPAKEVFFAQVHHPGRLSASDFTHVLNQTIEDVERFGTPVDVELRAGEVSLHSDLLLHGSEANASARRRCGLTLRYCAADVRAGLGWNAKGVLVSGADPAGHWANPPRPAAD